jgi:hypothetical protein
MLLDRRSECALVHAAGGKLKPTAVGRRPRDGGPGRSHDCTTFSQQHAGAVLITNSTFLGRRTEQLAALPARHALPAIFVRPEFVLAGGLMSYGSNLRSGNQQVGIYTGRILKGEKPADLPVQQITTIELAIISRPPRRSASPSRKRCWPSPTRWFNEEAAVHRGSGNSATSAAGRSRGYLTSIV